MFVDSWVKILKYPKIMCKWLNIEWRDDDDVCVAREELSLKMKFNHKKMRWEVFPNRTSQAGKTLKLGRIGVCWVLSLYFFQVKL